MTGEALAQPSPTERRRAVVVNGKRVKTIDVHAHCEVPEAMALMGRKVPLETLVVTEDRIKVMDEQGIDIEALSLNPVFWYKADPDLGAANCQAPERKARRRSAPAHPDRFCRAWRQ